MSETRDKRRKSDLDLFVLALIRSGVSTPYSLQKEAGLSPGATIPSIQRMLDAGLIRQGKPGLRGRTDVRLSAAGKKQLKDGWRLLVAKGASGDLDADLRVALLAISEGKAYSSAVRILKQSATKMPTIQKEPPTNRDLENVSLAGLYRELRAVSVRALLDGQAAAAQEIAVCLPKKLPRERKARTTTTQERAS